MSTLKWNCLLRNTLNTISTLGHYPIVSQSPKETLLTRAITTTRLSDVQKQTLDSVEYALRAHDYSTAISKKEEFNFSFLQQYASRYKFPLLVRLRMSYPTGHNRQRLNGFVPIEVEHETHILIVEGCHTQKTTIPLNEKN